MKKDRLLDLGFSERALGEAACYPELAPGRVVAQSNELYKVAMDGGELIAEISGKQRYEAASLTDYPAVGDFVMIGPDGIIRKILTRKSLFVRKASGTAHKVQVVAANIDFVFICMSLNKDFNLRRLERYLSIAWDSGAVPVVVLTKPDLCDDLPGRIREVEEVALGADLVVASGIEEEGLAGILGYVTPGRTVAFMGSSGVGKTTLINRLLGRDMLETRPIGRDDKGRHATTSRELILVPGGGAVIDTPGMRELGLESANLARAFADLDAIARGCRFKDCSHAEEPGCAVKAAVASGELSEERLESYRKLKKEARYEGLNSRQIDKEKIEEMFSEFGGIKNARKHAKSKNKN